MDKDLDFGAVCRMSAGWVGGLMGLACGFGVGSVWGFELMPSLALSALLGLVFTWACRTICGGIHPLAVPGIPLADPDYVVSDAPVAAPRPNPPTPPIIAARGALGEIRAGGAAAPVASAPVSDMPPPAPHWSAGVAGGSAAGAMAPSGGAGPAGLKPSAPLSGEEGLRDGVGSWRYQGDGDHDGDGVVEGADEGVKPASLTAAREGGADDLKQIKGVGPKLETLLNSMGFYHFDQIAGWTADEIAWVDANLEGFKGRVSRDAWVAQAATLASGGETEFSKKVEGGGVY